MKEITKKQWDYVLYEQDYKLIFAVVSGSVAVNMIKYLLTKEQADSYANNGNNYLDVLSKQIRENPEEFVTQKLS